MTHPLLHSESSTRLFGGDCQLWLPIHEYLDNTKQAFGDFRHRAMRHHRQGVLRCSNEVVINGVSQNDVFAVAEQHVREDCGGQLPEITEWLEHFQCKKLGKLAANVMSTEEINESCARRFKAHAGDFSEINGWIDGHNDPEGIDASAHPAARYLRHQSYSCFEVEEIFGITIALSDGRQIPSRYIAEYHITQEFGFIPSLSEWLCLIQPKPFMARASFIRQQEIR